jgi:hypothetical protein
MGGASLADTWADPAAPFPDSIPMSQSSSTIATTPMREYAEIHATTDGWFHLGAAAIWDALLCFQEANGVRGHMLEVGVWHGKSAALLAQHADPAQEVCILVDKFLARARVEATLRRVRGTLDQSIKLLACCSRELPNSQFTIEGRNQFRFAHIDGEHTAGAAYSDLTLANSLLRQDGLVCVDDFMNIWYPQITEVVFRYLREHPEQFTMFLCGYNKAFLARPHFVHRYLEFTAEKLIDELDERSVAATLYKTTWPAEMNCFGIGDRRDDTRHRGPDWDPSNIRY